MLPQPMQSGHPARRGRLRQQGEQTGDRPCPSRLAAPEESKADQPFRRPVAPAAPAAPTHRKAGLVLGTRRSSSPRSRTCRWQWPTSLCRPSASTSTPRRRSSTWSPSPTRSGLACSVLWLGALGDRYGRKLMALLGVTLAIPAALISGFAPTINGADLRPALWRLRGRHGLPHYALPDRGAVGARPRPHTLDRAVGGHRRRDFGHAARCCRACC